MTPSNFGEETERLKNSVPSPRTSATPTSANGLPVARAWTTGIEDGIVSLKPWAYILEFNSERFRDHFVRRFGFCSKLACGAPYKLGNLGGSGCCGCPPVLVDKCPRPEEIIWRNIGNVVTLRNLRLFLAFMVLLAGGTGIGIGLMFAQESMSDSLDGRVSKEQSIILVSLIISSANAIYALLMQKYFASKKHRTRTSRSFWVFYSVVAVQTVNVGFFVIFKTYRECGQTFLSECFITELQENVLWLMIADVVNNNLARGLYTLFIQKVLKLRWCAFQWPILYANVWKTIISSCMYCNMTYYIFPLAAADMLVQFILEWQLLKLANNMLSKNQKLEAEQDKKDKKKKHAQRHLASRHLKDVLCSGDRFLLKRPVLAFLGDEFIGYGLVLGTAIDIVIMQIKWKVFDPPDGRDMVPQFVAFIFIGLVLFFTFWCFGVLRLGCCRHKKADTSAEERFWTDIPRRDVYVPTQQVLGQLVSDTYLRFVDPAFG